MGRAVAVALLLLVPYALFGLFVPPTPETPYGDDFDYAATAWHLAETGVLKLSDWPTTMLASHAAWGALFCKVGGNNYFMLRLSMFALSAMTAFLLYHWSQRLGHSRGFAAWCGVTFAVNPLTVSLEYSFLTDITGAALGCLLVVLGKNVARQHRAGLLLCYGVLGGVALLARQTAAIPYVIVVSMTAWRAVKIKADFRKLLLLLAPCLVLVLGFRYWLAVSHGVPANHRFPFLQYQGLAQHAARIVTLLFGLAVHLAPLAAVLAAFAWPGRRAWTWLTVTAAAVGASVLVTARFDSWPVLYHGEIFDLGLHAIEFPAGEIPAALQGPAWTIGGRRISALRTVLLAVSTLSLVVLLPACLRGQTAAGPRSRLRVPSLVTLTFLANVALLVVTWVYVDRYLVSLIPLALMILAERLTPGQAARGLAARLGWGATLVVGACSLVGIQDGMQRTETFWRTARLVHSLGVSAMDVDAGLAYGGHFRYSPTYRGTKQTGPYLDSLSPNERQSVIATYSPLSLSANRPVGISFGDLENCHVVASVPFRSWFRTGEVRVLLRNGVEKSELPAAFLEWISAQEPAGAGRVTRP